MEITKDDLDWVLRGIASASSEDMLAQEIRELLIEDVPRNTDGVRSIGLRYAISGDRYFWQASLHFHDQFQQYTNADYADRGGWGSVLNGFFEGRILYRNNKAAEEGTERCLAVNFEEPVEPVA